MEKLVKLLNEFNKENIPEEFKEILPDEIEYVFWDYFLTKKAGFIERLVKNDKIKLDFWFIYHTYDEDELWEKYSDLDSLIMILSIKDKPLDYLCKIIKE